MISFIEDETFEIPQPFINRKQRLYHVPEIKNNINQDPSLQISIDPLTNKLILLKPPLYLLVMDLKIRTSVEEDRTPSNDIMKYHTEKFIMFDPWHFSGAG